MVSGDEYTFLVDGLERIDPSCVDVNVNSTRSVVPRDYAWRNQRKTVPLHQSIYYEMQIGSFTTEGTFAAAAEKLPYLARLGITVVELMPVMHFCGDADSWGYCPRAPYAVRPELGGSYGLKSFVDRAAGEHMRGSIEARSSDLHLNV